MPLRKSKKYIVFAREDLFEQVEERALTNTSFTAVARFFYEEIITRHEVFGKLVSDGGPKNKKQVQNLMIIYGIPQVTTLAYNFRTNSLVKGEYRLIINSLFKITRGS